MSNIQDTPIGTVPDTYKIEPKTLDDLNMIDLRTVAVLRAFDSALDAKWKRARFGEEKISLGPSGIRGSRGLER